MYYQTIMSMQNGIVNGVTFNPKSDMKFAKPKTTDGRKSIRVYNRENKTFYMQVPLMLTWGMNEFQEKDKEGLPIEGSRVSYDMALQFPSEDYMTDQMRKFKENIEKLEEYVKEIAFDNAKEWLSLPKPIKDVTDAFFTPILKYPKDKETKDIDYTRSPSMKVKIPYWEGEFKGFEIYSVNQELLFPSPTIDNPMELITKGSNVATILQCGGIWVSNKSYGLTWKLFQAVVKPRETLAGKCHIMLSLDDKEKLDKTSEAELPDEEILPETVVEVKQPQQTVEEKAQVADSDDEEAHPEPEPEPEPEPVVEKAVEVEDKPKPKKVVKKTAPKK